MQPKQILPGQLLMSTRRTLGRQMLITPNRKVANAFGYFVALAARRTLTGVFGGIAMSNHPHLGLIDSAGWGPGVEIDEKELLPRVVERLNGGDQRVGTRDLFFELLHGWFARWRNVDLGNRRGQFWDGERVHELPLVRDDDVEKYILYMLANPQRAGVCRHPWEWKGWWLGPRHWEETHTFEKPKGLFVGPNWPETVDLYVFRPPIRHEMSTNELRTRLLERAKADGERVHAERLAKGKRSYSGALAARRVRPTSKPKSPPEPRHERKARLGTADEDLIEKLKIARAAFLNSYRVAQQRLKAGLPAIFPAGTVRLPTLVKTERGLIKPDEPSLRPQPP